MRFLAQTSSLSVPDVESLSYEEVMRGHPPPSSRPIGPLTGGMNGSAEQQAPQVAELQLTAGI